MINTINRKIKHIRKQPEHIRLRWILVMVSISMTAVVLLWLLSIQDQLRTVTRTLEPVEQVDIPPLGGEIQSLREALETTAEEEAASATGETPPAGR